MILRVLNLSFNDIQGLLRSFFKKLTRLEELYFSGNSLQMEDLCWLVKLEVLFLNGNRLQTLPQELGKVPSLAVLDVGSIILKYNWEFDRNWWLNPHKRELQPEPAVPQSVGFRSCVLFSPSASALSLSTFVLLGFPSCCFVCLVRHTCFCALEGQNRRRRH
jgi:hypothetical protein